MIRNELRVGLLAIALLAGCARTQEARTAEAGGGVATSTPPPSGVAGLAQGAQGGTLLGAANAFIGTLDSAQRAKGVFPWGREQRTRWSNLPTGIYQRTGLRMGDLTAAQRQSVHAMLRAALSTEGYRKVLDIMSGDSVLKLTDSGGPGGRLVFGKDEYYLAFIGTPSTTAPWMLQFGGHHLAINVTMAGGSSALTPSLPATQPATFQVEGRIVRPLGDEYDKAFALINALDATQQGQAILGFQMRDLVLGPGQDGKTIVPEGIPASRLNAAQQAMLLDLAGEWVNILNDQGAAARMAEIRRNLADTYFAWSGPTQKGRAAYFRIQGPTVVIEYAPQGRETGTDQGVDHVHTIYRDPTNDYGARLAGR